MMPPGAVPIPAPPARVAPASRRVRAMLAVVGFALAASIVGLPNDFVYDDGPLIRDHARVHTLDSAAAILTKPYWPPPFAEQLYRPAASLLLAVEYAAGGGAPWVFRATSYLLYAACAALLLGLLGTMTSPRAALAASILFAVHPVHVEAVALGVNQGELIVGLLGLLMVGRYLRRREGAGMRPRDWLELACWYAIAVLTKENGMVLPALLLAAELTLLRGARPDPWKSRLLGIALLAGVAMLAVAARVAVLGGPVGARPAADLFALSLGERAVLMLQVVPHWFRLLVWPQRLQVDFAAGTFVLPDGVGVIEVAGLALVIGFVTALLALRHRLPAASFGLAWCGIALLPVSNLVPTGIILAERTLFLPSIGFLIAAAAVGARLASAWPGRPMLARRLLLGGCAVLTVLGLVRSVSRHSVWNSAHLVVQPGPGRDVPRP